MGQYTQAIKTVRSIGLDNLPFAKEKAMGSNPIEGLH